VIRGLLARPVTGSPATLAVVSLRCYLPRSKTEGPAS